MLLVFDLSKVNFCSCYYLPRFCKYRETKCLPYMATPNQCAMLQFMLENSKSSYAYSGINLLSYALSAS